MNDPQRARRSRVREGPQHADALRRTLLPKVHRLVQRWREWDRLQLSAQLAALQLLSENTPFSARLLAAGNLASTLASDGASRPRLEWLNGEVFGQHGFGRLDDPYEEWFTESVPFFGGPYTILPGREGARGALLRHLLHAIYFSDDYDPRTVPQETTAMVRAALRLSHGMALRAGLLPGMGDRASARQNVRIPNDETMARLAKAVRWSHADLDELLAPGSVADLARLTRVRPTRAGIARLLDDEELLRPLWRRGDELLITHPLTLCARLCAALIEAIIRAGHGPELAKALHQSAAAETATALRRFGWVPQGAWPAGVRGRAVVSEQVWMFDRGRFGHIILASDALVGWRWGAPWRFDFGGLTHELASAATTTLGAKHELLSILIVQDAGRWAPVSLGPLLLGAGHQYLAASANELDVISSLDPDALALWKFCAAMERLEATALVHASTSLATYGAHRQSGSRLGLVSVDLAARVQEGARPLLLLSPGAGGELRNEVTDRYDAHFERWLDEDSFVRVFRLTIDPPASLYVVEGADRAARLWRAGDRAVWVVGPTGLKDPERRLHEAFVDVVAYWLWQLEASASRFTAESTEPTVLTVVVDDPAPFLGDSLVATTGAAVTWTVHEGRHTVHVTSALVPLLLGREDNQAERTLMRAAIGALAHANALTSTDAELDAAIDRAMPLGNKRRLPVGPDDADIDPTGLPPLRAVQPYDASEAERFVAERVRLGGWRPGPVSTTAAPGLLNEVVAALFDRICATVRQLEAKPLLEILVTYNERFLMERALESATLRTEIACWSGEAAVFARLQGPAQERSSNAGALRFLIEVASALAPSGTRGFDLVTYDELLALALQVLELGATSDALHFGLADHGPIITPSHRVVPSEGQIPTVQAALLDALTRQNFARATGDGSGTREPMGTAESWAALSRAFSADLGVSLEELIGALTTLYQAGEEQDGAAKSLQRDDALRRLVAGNGGDRMRADRALEFWSLGPRSLLPPPQPYRREDVYPWRHNRQLSYLRRPLLVRGHGDAAQLIWGQRALRESGIYVAALCGRGRFPRAGGAEIDRALSRLRATTAAQFNDDVAALLRAPRFRVRTRVRELDGHRLRDGAGELGDIDVLVADLRFGVLYWLETKDLGGARTPYEIAHELGTFTGRAGSLRAGLVARQQRRVAWLEQHRAQLGQLLGVHRAGWRPEWLLVSDAPLALGSVEPRMLTADQLAKRIEDGTEDLTRRHGESSTVGDA